MGKHIREAGKMLELIEIYNYVLNGILRNDRHGMKKKLLKKIIFSAIFFPLRGRGGEEFSPHFPTEIFEGVLTES